MLQILQDVHRNALSRMNYKDKSTGFTGYRVNTDGTRVKTVKHHKRNTVKTEVRKVMIKVSITDNNPVYRGYDNGLRYQQRYNQQDTRYATVKVYGM